MDLQGKNILVTGGAGFIGSHIVDALLRENVNKVFILDNFYRGSHANLKHLKRNKNVRVVEGDIRDISLVRRLVKKSDYIFHEAAIRLLKCAEDPRLCQDVMVDGTYNILEAASQSNIKKIIMASSVSVYGEPSYVPIDENHPYNNTTAYGAAKIANEHMSIAFHHMHKIPIILLRYFNVYGPRMDILGAYTEVLIKWLEKIDKGESPIIHGKGDQSLDFVYVEEVARANILALKSKIDFGIYNIGTGQTTSLKTLLALLIEITNARVKPTFDTTTKRPFVQKRQADIRLAKKDLKFLSKVSMRDGLKALIRWREKRIKETPYEKNSK